MLWAEGKLESGIPVCNQSCPRKDNTDASPAWSRLRYGAATRMRRNVHLTVIGDGGCFVDTVVPLEDGSLVSLKVKDDSGSMEIPGKILYVQPGFGSAIAFDPMDTSLRQRIEKIIASAGT